FTTPADGRDGIGALHLAAVSGGVLTYVGRVGSGFTASELVALRRRLETTERTAPPVEGDLPSGSEHHWVEPRLVAEVAFTEITSSGQLRHPVFRRWRDDKSVRDCTRDDLPAAEPPPRAEAPTPEAPPRTIEVSRPEKLFWPAEGYTKGDLFDYYATVAPRLMPFLADRPLVLDRYPDGIEGKSFYQKNAPEFAPEWIRTETVWSEEGDKETEYLVCDSREALLYVVNLGTIPLHVWSSRIGSLGRPDWCILDLDPKEAPFEHVVDVARAIHALCRRIELPSFPKTSGGSGLHILLPLGGQLTHEQSRQLAELIARIIVQQLPDIATVARAVSARDDKVYLDYVQNGYGKLLVAPYSVRPYPGAKVSTPLSWSEVTRRLDPAHFTLVSLPERLAGEARCHLAPVLATRPDLPAVLGRLAQELEAVSDADSP
ncbi:MAG: non-homologous end-joining DNA ligase, partial [Thermoanaerobaculia bacterium]|nr:non-homologous end-joining DNA ligase [Thermoanaerobaculia bacterium]